MMGSFVEAQNNLKRMSHAGCVTLAKTRQSHAVRFSFMPMVMKSPGLKPIEAENARSSSACVPYLASMSQNRKSARLLDHLVGTVEQRWWHVETKRFRGPQVAVHFSLR